MTIYETGGSSTSGGAATTDLTAAFGTARANALALVPFTAGKWGSLELQFAHRAGFVTTLVGSATVVASTTAKGGVMTLNCAGAGTRSVTIQNGQTSEVPTLTGGGPTSKWYVEGSCKLGGAVIASTKNTLGISGATGTWWVGAYGGHSTSLFCANAYDGSSHLVSSTIPLDTTAYHRKRLWSDGLAVKFQVDDETAIVLPTAQTADTKAALLSVEDSNGTFAPLWDYAIWVFEVN